MLEIENNLESITNVFRANEKINSNNTCKQVTLSPKNPILQAIKMVSISDLNYIYNFYKKSRKSRKISKNNLTKI